MGQVTWSSFICVVASFGRSCLLQPLFLSPSSVLTSIIGLFVIFFCFFSVNAAKEKVPIEMRLSQLW
jgi:hypothetical protein